MDQKILTEKNIKDYFAKKKGAKPLLKYASFYFLLYLAKKADIQTAENISKQIVEETLDGEILESLLSNILGYC